MEHLKIWRYLSIPWVGFSIVFFIAFLGLAFLQDVSESFLTSALISKLLINTVSLTILVGFFTFIIAAPVVTRDARPDGLTREYIVQGGLKYNFY